MIENDVEYKYTLIIFIKTPPHDITASERRVLCAAKNEVTRLLFRPSKTSDRARE